jgi:acid stress-induced BolA-like protein IbaG/YrbA
MLPTPDYVRDAIAAGLACERLEVSGDGQHFEALIVSSAFEGKSSEIHALSMRTLTPAEYEASR